MTLRIALYDLDNTLYPFSAGLMEAINDRISLFVQQRLQINETEAMHLRHTFYETYGTTLAGLQKHYGNIDTETYLQFVHDITVEHMISADLQLYKVLESLPLQKVIFTNSPYEWASRVLKQLGISDHFSHLFDIRSFEFLAKPNRRAYDVALQTLKANGPECVLFEDTPGNLGPARQLGMTTVLISHETISHPDADWVFPDVVSATTHLSSHVAGYILNPPVTSIMAPLT